MYRGLVEVIFQLATALHPLHLFRQERENHDLRLEEAREGAKEYRNTVLEGELVMLLC